MADRVYDRQLIVWEIDVLEQMAKDGLAVKYGDNWVVKKAGGGALAVRPDQILLGADEPHPGAWEAQAKDEAYAEGAWLRAAEAGDPGEIELERQMDAQRGVVDFEDAWDAADPVHAAGRALRHAQRGAYEQAVFENGKTSLGLEAPEWEARMNEIVAEILAEQGSSIEAEEAKIDAVVRAQALADKVAQEDDLLKKFGL